MRGLANGGAVCAARDDTSRRRDLTEALSLWGPAVVNFNHADANAVVQS